MKALARLEYGKLCVRTDGDALLMEHAVLLRTPGFPAAPRPEGTREPCDWSPDLHGPEPGPDFGFRTRPDRPGLVLRSFRIGDGIWPVWCHQAERPEDPSRVRRYTSSRYLSTPRPVAWCGDAGSAPELHATPSPWTWFSSDCAHPHRAWSRADLEGLGPLVPPCSPPPEADEEARAFVREALIFVLSGTSVVVRDTDEAPVEPARLFQLADLIHGALPPPLRSTFGCGWNVSPALCSRLMVSSANALPSDTAVYEPASGRWSPPHEVRPVGLAAPAAFGPSWLSPGQTWVSEVVGRGPESGATALDPAMLSCDRLPPLSPPAGPVDMGTPAVRGRMRRPGLDLRQAWLVAGALQWLADGQGAPAELGDLRSDAIGAPAVALAIKYVRGESDLKAAQVVRAMRFLRGSEGRADASAVWERARRRLREAGFSDEVATLVLSWPLSDEVDLPGSTLERLVRGFLQLARATRDALLDGPEHEACALALWSRCIKANGSRTDGALPVPAIGKAVLLHVAARPEGPIRAWLADHVAQLVAPLAAAGALEAAGREARRIVAVLQDQPRAEALAWACDPLAPCRAEVVAELTTLSGAEAASIVAARERMLWEGPSGGPQLDAAWDWVVALHATGLAPTRALSRALLGLADETSAQELREVVEGGRCPPSARARLGRILLVRWDELMGQWFAAKGEARETWAWILATWPHPQSLLLTGRDLGCADDDATWPERLDPGSTPALLQALRPVLEQDGLRPENAGYLFALLAATGAPEGTTLPDFCLALASGRLPALDQPPADLELARLIVRRAALDLSTCWSGVTRAWQANFLLRCGETTALGCTPRAVVALLGDPPMQRLVSRCALVGGLPEPLRSHPPLVVFTAGPFELRPQDGVWDDAYARSPLALAFVGLPREDQPRLSPEALAALAEVPEMPGLLARYAAQPEACVQFDAIEEHWIAPFFQKLELGGLRTQIEAGWDTLACHRGLRVGAWKPPAAWAVIVVSWLYWGRAAWATLDGRPDGPAMLDLLLAYVGLSALSIWWLVWLVPRLGAWTIRLQRHGDWTGDSAVHTRRGALVLDLQEGWVTLLDALYGDRRGRGL